jgi:hypothetical protein
MEEPLDSTCEPMMDEGSNLRLFLMLNPIKKCSPLLSGLTGNAQFSMLVDVLKG